MLPAPKSQSVLLFLSTLSLRRATLVPRRRWNPLHNISIHTLLAESDFSIYAVMPHILISIHTLLAESDNQGRAVVQPLTKFLSTLSLRRATQGTINWQQTASISIHTLLAESDIAASQFRQRTGHFYPHSPCGERHGKNCHTSRPTAHFYPHSPCGERHLTAQRAVRGYTISIHTLLAESDFLNPVPTVRKLAFLSTLSLRRATGCRPAKSLPQLHFYPHSPCGERRVVPPVKRSSCPFLSTLSLRRATRWPAAAGLYGGYFYPHSPCGERPPCPRCSRGTLPISIHTLLAESDTCWNPSRR